MASKPGNARVHLTSLVSESVGGRGIGHKFTVEVRNVKTLPEAERRAKSYTLGYGKYRHRARIDYVEWID